MKKNKSTLDPFDVVLQKKKKELMAYRDYIEEGFSYDPEHSFIEGVEDDYDMEDDEIRNTEAYKIAYKTLNDYAIERDGEPMDEWETCHDIMEYTRIPQNIVWLAISDWQAANNE